MPTVVLDTEALSALATGRPAARFEAVRALVRDAQREEDPVVVPSAVLAEADRGTGADAAIDRVLGADGGVRVVTTGQAMARVAGALRHRDRLDSCHVVDCVVVATALRLGASMIVTADEVDMRRLARDADSPLRVLPV